jgi:hypothetical protein
LQYPRGMRLSLLLVVALAGCGDRPALVNAPRPNPAAVAGAAAAVAGAATLANPDAAGRAAAEANKPDPSNKPKKSGGTVPPDVLDRLDQKAPPGPPQPVAEPQPQPPPE